MTTIEGRAVNEYDKGDNVRLKAFFTADGSLADPTNVILNIRKPDGTFLSYTYGVGATISRDTTGTYHANFFVDDDGRWDYRWAGSGTVQSAQKWFFIVRRTEFP